MEISASGDIVVASSRSEAWAWAADGESLGHFDAGGRPEISSSESTILLSSGTNSPAIWDLGTNRSHRLEGTTGSAALTFTCNGRGERLFGRPHHDAELVHALTGSSATAGMFCAGELGPVNGANHVHGFTASTLVFTD